MTQTWDCTDARPSLGVYVLGAIDPAERSLVDAHLTTCRDCRDELAGLAVVDVDHLSELPAGRERRQRSLNVDAHVAGAKRQLDPLRERQAGLEGSVHEQSPDPLVGDVSDQLLDVDAPVSQRAAVAVGLGDLGREGDHALQSRPHLVLRVHRLHSTYSPVRL